MDERKSRAYERRHSSLVINLGQTQCTFDPSSLFSSLPLIGCFFSCLIRAVWISKESFKMSAYNDLDRSSRMPSLPLTPYN